MYGMGINYDYIEKRIRACDYLTVAQLFLQDDFLLERPLSFSNIKPRLLGHWGTCHGINVAYAHLKSFFDDNFQFVLGPGHGFPALQANLFLDGDLLKVDSKAQRNIQGLAYICRNFSWPSGFPSHASPMTPGVISEGGELGYALATAYGAALGHPEKNIAVLIGDGEFETATALASMNLVKLVGTSKNGNVIPILHLNGYKISAPTIYARKSERELMSLIRGFGYTPILVDGEDPEAFQIALANIYSTYGINQFASANGQSNYANSQNVSANIYNASANVENANVNNKDAYPVQNPFIIMKTEKGATGPEYVNGKKVEGNYLAHQIPLKNAKTDKNELGILETWLKSYNFGQLFNDTEGFTL